MAGLKWVGALAVVVSIGWVLLQDEEGGSFSGPVPRDCFEPTGEDCSFYLTCNLAQPACPLMNTVAAKCNEFGAAEADMTEMGRKWAIEVRGCLQRRISKRVFHPLEAEKVAVRGKEVALKSDFACKTFPPAFFEEHLTCYLHEEISFCNLPVRDKAIVALLAREFLLTKDVGAVFHSSRHMIAQCGFLSLAEAGVEAIMMSVGAA